MGHSIKAGFDRIKAALSRRVSGSDGLAKLWQELWAEVSLNKHGPYSTTISATGLESGLIQASLVTFGLTLVRRDLKSFSLTFTVMTPHIQEEALASCTAIKVIALSASIAEKEAALSSDAMQFVKEVARALPSIIDRWWNAVRGGCTKWIHHAEHFMYLCGSAVMLVDTFFNRSCVTKTTQSAYQYVFS